MKYMIEAFDKRSGFLEFEEELPSGLDEAIKKIMGWTTDQQGSEGYDLSRGQIEALEKLMEKKIYDSFFKFQLSCNV